MPAEIPPAAQLLAAHTIRSRATGPPPGGRIVYLPRGADHTCTPPLRTVPRFQITLGERPTEPDAPDGAVWRCNCGRRWTAARTRGAARAWRRATWTERLKAALLTHHTPGPVIDAHPAPPPPAAEPGTEVSGG